MGGRGSFFTVRALHFVLLYDTDRGITTIVITYGMSREEVLKVVGSIQY